MKRSPSSSKIPTVGDSSPIGESHAGTEAGVPSPISAAGGASSGGAAPISVREQRFREREAARTLGSIAAVAPAATRDTGERGFAEEDLVTKLTNQEV